MFKYKKMCYKTCYYLLLFVGRGFERLSQLFAQNANVTVPDTPIDLTTSGRSMPLPRVNPPPGFQSLDASLQVQGTLNQRIPPAHLHPPPEFYSLKSSTAHDGTSADAIPPAHTNAPPQFSQVTSFVPPPTSVPITQQISAQGSQVTSGSFAQDTNAENIIIPPVDNVHVDLQTDTSKASTSFPPPPPPPDFFSDASIPDAMLLEAESE